MNRRWRFRTLFLFWLMFFFLLCFLRITRVVRSRFWDNWAVALCSSFKEEKKNKEWFNYVFCVAFRLVCSWHLRYKRNYEEKINVSVVTNQDLFHAAPLCSTIVFLMRLHVPGLIQNEPVSFRSIFSVFAGSDFFRLVKYPAFDFLPRISFSSCLLLRYVDMPGRLLSHLFLGTLFSHTAIKRGRGNPTGIGWIMKNRAPFWNVVLTTLFVASFEFYVFFFCFDVGRADVSLLVGCTYPRNKLRGMPMLRSNFMLNISGSTARCTLLYISCCTPYSQILDVGRKSPRSCFLTLFRLFYLPYFNTSLFTVCASFFSRLLSLG